MSTRRKSFKEQRSDMVQQQLVARGVLDRRVLDAMEQIPRELFVQADYVEHAYSDSALSIGHNQTISQPYMVARTCELAELTGSEKVLEVGAGSGYQAGVLGLLSREVYSIEIVSDFVERARDALKKAHIPNVKIILGDGSLGYPEEAPYDCIVVAAAAPAIPEALIAQLAIKGRLIVPVGQRDVQTLLRVCRTDDGLSTEEFDLCMYVPLIGEQGWQKNNRQNRLEDRKT